MNPSLRTVVLIVAALNLGYFAVEFGVARRIAAVSLFADSIDFLEDAAVNLVIAVAVGWSVARRARVGLALAGLLLVPGLATLWTLWAKLQAPSAPEALALTLTGAGALVVNVGCALLLARFRHRHGSLSAAAFLSARNDAAANVAIIATGAVTAYTASAWPDVLVGLGIAAMNADAAMQVWQTARAEQRGVESA